MNTNNPFPVGYQPAQVVYPPVMYPTVPMQQQNSLQNSNVISQPLTPNLNQGSNTPSQNEVIQPAGSNMLMVDGRQIVEKWVLNKGETMVFFDRNKDVFYIKSVSEQGMPFPIEECVFKRKVDDGNEPETIDQNRSKYVTSDELDKKFDDLHREIFELLSNKSNEKEVNTNGRQLIV